jgi:hypothetical protein
MVVDLHQIVLGGFLFMINVQGAIQNHSPFTSIA